MSLNINHPKGPLDTGHTSQQPALNRSEGLVHTTVYADQAGHVQEIIFNTVLIQFDNTMSNSVVSPSNTLNELFIID